MVVDCHPVNNLVHNLPACREFSAVQTTRFQAVKQLIAGRLCATKKNEASTVSGKTVFAALDAASHSATQVLTLYRMRWQIDLVFKRSKSFLRLGHLKKHDEVAARA